MYHWKRSTVSRAHTSLPRYPWRQWFQHLSLHHLLIHLFIFNETRGHMSVYSLVYKHLGKVLFKSTLLWDSFQSTRPCKVESDNDKADLELKDPECISKSLPCTQWVIILHSKNKCFSNLSFFVTILSHFGGIYFEECILQTIMVCFLMSYVISHINIV